MAERRTREGTATSEFGVSKRENHDSTSFYERFPAPTLLDDDTVVPCPVKDTIFCGGARPFRDSR